MKKIKRCIDCGRPYSTPRKWICGQCKSERRRLRELHGYDGDPRYTAIKAARVAAYARRVERGVPLFEPPLTRKEIYESAE